MTDLNKMRTGVLRELKNVRRFFDNIESSVRSRNPVAIQKAYMLLVHLVREMDDGMLTPNNIALDVALAQEFNGANYEHNAGSDQHSERAKA